MLLEEYKFNVTVGSNIGSYGEFWFDKPVGEGSISVPFHPQLLEWSKAMQETIQEIPRPIHEGNGFVHLDSKAKS